METGKLCQVWLKTNWLRPHFFYKTVIFKGKGREGGEGVPP